MKNERKVLLVDNHPIFLKGLVEVIQDEFPSFNLYSFTSSEKALHSAKENRYDLAIFDLDMLIINGISLSKELKLLNHEIVSIILTIHKEQDIMQSVFAKGIEGYVLKDNVVDELIIAIEEVLKGNKYISELGIINKYNEQNGAIKSLTKIEILILKCISENKTSEEMAYKFFISKNTIENHYTTISRKLQLQGKESLLQFAITNKHLL